MATLTGWFIDDSFNNWTITFPAVPGLLANPQNIRIIVADNASMPFIAMVNALFFRE
jgi:hypothetical protein